MEDLFVKIIMSVSELTSIRINIKTRCHSISVHYAIFDLSIDAHVSIMSLDAQDERSWRLILQDCCVQAIVLTLTTKQQSQGSAFVI